MHLVLVLVLDVALVTATTTMTRSSQASFVPPPTGPPVWSPCTAARTPNGCAAASAANPLAIDACVWYAPMTTCVRTGSPSSSPNKDNKDNRRCATDSYGCQSTEFCDYNEGTVKGRAMRCAANAKCWWNATSNACQNLFCNEACTVKPDFYCNPMCRAGSCQLCLPMPYLCDDACAYARDGHCDDGGANATSTVCEFGSDCSDCGIRFAPGTPTNSSDGTPPPTAPTEPDYLAVDYTFVGATLAGNISRDAPLALVRGLKRWESLITGGISDFATIGPQSYGCPGLRDTYEPDGRAWAGVLVYIMFAPVDGVGGSIALAGPCRYDARGFPRVGMLVVDIADVESASLTRLASIATHQMAHILGFGVAWDERGLTTTRRVRDNNNNNGGGKGGNDKQPRTVVEYVGHGGRRGLEEAGGSGNPQVESASATTTDNPILSHWRKSSYGDELMTNQMTSDNPPLSLMSLRAMQDLGYSVAWTLADPYGVPSPSSSTSSGGRAGRRRALRGDARSVELANDVLHFEEIGLVEDVGVPEERRRRRLLLS